MLLTGTSLITCHRRLACLYVPCTQSPSYMPSRTASRSRHLALLYPETPPRDPFLFLFLRCFLNFLSSHVVLLHHETPPPRPSSASASASSYSTSS